MNKNKHNVEKPTTRAAHKAQPVAASLQRGIGPETETANQQPNPLKASGLLRLRPAGSVPALESESTTVRRFPEPIPFHQIEALTLLIEARKASSGCVIPFRIFPSPIKFEQDRALRKLLRYQSAA